VVEKEEQRAEFCFVYGWQEHSDLAGCGSLSTYLVRRMVLQGNQLHLLVQAQQIKLNDMWQLSNPRSLLIYRAQKMEHQELSLNLKAMAMKKEL
jgi:hypothetical protein